MSRAGREPAEDVKRRMAQACRAAGLRVRVARMYLDPAQRQRLIMVGASPMGYAPEEWLISLFAMVGVDGNWSGTVDVRSGVDLAGEGNGRGLLFLRGRHRVPLEDLADAIAETVEEHGQVEAAVLLGVKGPYEFASTTWVPMPSFPTGEEL